MTTERLLRPTVETWPVESRQVAVDLLRVQLLDLVDACSLIDRLDASLLLASDLHALAIHVRRFCDAVVSAHHLAEERADTLAHLDR